MIKIERQTKDRAFPIKMSKEQHLNFAQMAKKRRLPLSKIIRALLENAYNLKLNIEPISIQKEKSMSVRLTDSQHSAFAEYAKSLNMPLNDIIVSLLQNEYNEFKNQG